MTGLREPDERRRTVGRGAGAAAPRPWSRYASRLSGFALATLVNGLVGFATIPVLIAAGGASSWAVLALGQTVGGIGMVLIGWGWNISGTAEAALLDKAQAQALLLRSVAIRTVLAVPVTLLAAVVAYLIAPYQPMLAAIGAAGFALNGLTAAWFYTGMRTPRALLMREVVPRTAFIVLGLVVSLLVGSVYPFSAFLAAGCILGAVLNVRGTGVRRFRLREHARDPLPDLRRQLPALATTLISTAYLSSPIVLVGLLAPRELAVFALAERLFRIANVAASPILSVLQGAIPSRDPQQFRERVGKALRALTALSLIAAAAFALGAPLLGHLVSGGSMQVPLAVSIPFAVTLVATYFSQVVGLSALVALGRVRSVAISAAVGAVVGLPLIVVTTLLLGASGAAAGEAVAEVAVTLYQLRALRLGLRAMMSADREEAA